jgi:lysophospholipase L1-like esterase
MRRRLAVVMAGVALTLSVEGAVTAQASSAAAPPARPAPANPAALADPASLLPGGWQGSSDEAVTLVGDGTGLHVLAASEASGYAWRTVATLGDPSVETDLWIGQDCVTGSGQSAVVVYAPEQATNMAGAQGELGRAAVVNLRTGAVHDLGGGYSIAYFDPGCGTGNTAVLTGGGWASDSSRAAMATTLATVDTTTGKLTSTVSVAGQATSATPYQGQTVVAAGKGLEEISATGATRLLTATSGTPFELTPDAAGGLGYQTTAGNDVDLWRVAGGKPQHVASVAKGSAELRQIGGHVWLVGPSAAKVRGLPPQWLPMDAPATSQPSTTGMLAVTNAGSLNPAKGAKADPTAPAPAGVNALVVGGGGQSATFEVPTSAAPPKPGTASPAPSAHAGAATSQAATTPGSATTPVSADRTCAIALNDPNVQAYQPTFQQIEWAADQAVQGTLTTARPSGLYGSALPSYSPQALFPLPANAFNGSASGYAIPPQVLLGVLTQESNLQQASTHVVQGQTSNPLSSFNWYGNWIDGDSVNTGLINWSNSDCGYGIGQITTGMCLAQGQNDNSQCTYATPMSAEDQLAVAVDYQANIAAAAQMLSKDYQQLTADGISTGYDYNTQYAGFPAITQDFINSWYDALWDYNSGVEPGTAALGNSTGCTPSASCTDGAGNWGLGYADNPANPAYPPDRPTYATSSQSNYPAPGGATYSLAWDLAHPQYWPYQDKVLAYAFDSITLYDYSQGKNVQAFAFAHGTYTQPPFDLWCSAANHCNASAINQTVATGPDPCQLTGAYADHCWWNGTSATWDQVMPGASCVKCGLGVITYAKGTAAPAAEPVAAQFAQTCSLPDNDSGLPGYGSGVSGTPSWTDAVIVEDGGTSALGCEPEVDQSWTPEGSFSWNFAADSNGTYSSKIDFDQIGAGFGGHFWFGYAQPSSTPASTVVTGTWSPPSTVNGWTDIEVAIPSYGANADGAVYQIDPGTGVPGKDVVIDQGAHAGRNTWVDLGEFYLTGLSSVSLSNVTPNADQSSSESGGDLAWSAMAFIPDPASGDTDTNPTDYPYTYTAMGDSYASGEGNGPYDPNTEGGCDRSQAAYGRQFASNPAYSSIGDADIHHIACSGATIADLTTTSQSDEQTPQISQIGTGSKLVTVSIGGNDLGFANVLTYCLNPANELTCESQYNSNNASNLYTIMDDTLEPELTSAYEAIQKAAPAAQVVAVTYPEIFQPGTTCSGILNMSIPNVQFLINVNLYLDNTIIAAAKAAGINVLDERYALLGHQLCSSDPWVYSLPGDFTDGTAVFDSSAWFHPTVDGLNQIASDLGQYWKALQQPAPPNVWPVALAIPSPNVGWLPYNLPNGIPTNAQATAMLNVLPVVASQLSTTTTAPTYTAISSSYNWPGSRNGWDTRNRVLLAQALTVAQGAPLAVVVGYSNQVVTGTWQYDYDTTPGNIPMPVLFSTKNVKPSSVTLDHVVPLANSWISGGVQWYNTYTGEITVSGVATTQGAQMLSDFGNDLGGPEFLTASGPSNSSKKNSPPQSWMPSNYGNAGVNCAYAKMWIAVKWEWNLSIISAEQNSLKNTIASQCQ